MKRDKKLLENKFKKAIRRQKVLEKELNDTKSSVERALSNSSNWQTSVEMRLDRETERSNFLKTLFRRLQNKVGRDENMLSIVARCLNERSPYASSAEERYLNENLFRQYGINSDDGLEVTFSSLNISNLMIQMRHKKANNFAAPVGVNGDTFFSVPLGGNNFGGGIHHGHFSNPDHWKDLNSIVKNLNSNPGNSEQADSQRGGLL